MSVTVIRYPGGCTIKFIRKCTHDKRKEKWMLLKGDGIVTECHWMVTERWWIAPISCHWMMVFRLVIYDIKSKRIMDDRTLYQFLAMNKLEQSYEYTSMFVKHNYYLFMEKDKKWKSPLPRNVLWRVWLKLVQCFLKVIFIFIVLFFFLL